MTLQYLLSSLGLEMNFSFLVFYDDNYNFKEYPELNSLAPYTYSHFLALLRHVGINVYEPIGMILKAGIIDIVGLNSNNLHFVSFAIHTVNTIVLYYWIVKLLSNNYILQFNKRQKLSVGVKFCVIISTLIFFIHPLNMEVIGWLSAQSYTFALLFSLLSSISLEELLEVQLFNYDSKNRIKIDNVDNNDDDDKSHDNNDIYSGNNQSCNDEKNNNINNENLRISYVANIKIPKNKISNSTNKTREKNSTVIIKTEKAKKAIFSRSNILKFCVIFFYVVACLCKAPALVLPGVHILRIILILLRKKLLKLVRMRKRKVGKTGKMEEVRQGEKNENALKNCESSSNVYNDRSDDSNIKCIENNIILCISLIIISLLLYSIISSVNSTEGAIIPPFRNKISTIIRSIITVSNFILRFFAPTDLHGHYQVKEENFYEFKVLVPSNPLYWQCLIFLIFTVFIFLFIFEDFNVNYFGDVSKVNNIILSPRIFRENTDEDNNDSNDNKNSHREKISDESNNDDNNDHNTNSNISQYHNIDPNNTPNNYPYYNNTMIPFGYISYLLMWLPGCGLVTHGWSQLGADRYNYFPIAYLMPCVVQVLIVIMQVRIDVGVEVGVGVRGCGDVEGEVGLGVRVGVSVGGEGEVGVGREGGVKGEGIVKKEVEGEGGGNEGVDEVSSHDCVDSTEIDNTRDWSNRKKNNDNNNDNESSKGSNNYDNDHINNYYDYSNNTKSKIVNNVKTTKQISMTKNGKKIKKITDEKEVTDKMSRITNQCPSVLKSARTVHTHNPNYYDSNYNVENMIKIIRYFLIISCFLIYFGSLCVVSRTQLLSWQNDKTLLNHCVSTDPYDYDCHQYLGDWYGHHEGNNVVGTYCTYFIMFVLYELLLSYISNNLIFIYYIQSILFQLIIS